MTFYFNIVTLFSTLLFLGGVNAHLAAFAKGMYCGYGDVGGQDLNSYAIVYPLYQLPFDKWWMHHDNNCDNYPPPSGEFLELPAGGSFTAEIASNRAKTSLSYGGRDTSDWPDGGHYPEDYNVPTCIISPNMHAENRSMAAGTAFAISYQSDIHAVTPENLVVFTVAYHTPWKRVTTYQVPSAMPACPPGGCTCAWGWVPNGCGQPNMYMQPFKCTVTGATSTTPVAKAQPPRWCEGDPNSCVKGAKQMIYWHQASGDNIEVDGYDLSGRAKSPSYNSKLGFADGAQNDIFTGAASGNTPYSPPSTPPAAAKVVQSPPSEISPALSPPAPSPAPAPAPAIAPPSPAPAPAVASPSPSPSPAVAPPSSGNNGTIITSSSGRRCKKRVVPQGGPSLVKKSSVPALHRRHARHLF